MSLRKRMVSNKKRFEIFKRDNFKCRYCGKCSADVILHIDHIVPFSKGGDTKISNLLTACQQCNIGKGNRSLEDGGISERRPKKPREVIKYSFGRNIRILLGDQNITYGAFAEKIGVHRTTVSKSWIDKGLKPDIYNASKIYEYFEGRITFADMGYTADQLGYSNE